MGWDSGFGGGGDYDKVSSEYYDKAGNLYQIIEIRDAGGTFQSAHREGYKARVYSPDGTLLASNNNYKSDDGGDVHGKLKKWLKDETVKLGQDPTEWMSESSYKDFKQTEEFTRDYDQALKKSEFKQKQSIEQAGKMQQTLQAQAGGTGLRQMQNALLQQGYTPEEAAEISSGGTESIQRASAGVQQQMEAQKAGVESQMAGMDIGKITSASQLENQLRQMTTQENQFAEQMAFQREQAESSWMDVLGGMAGMAAGSFMGGVGTNLADKWVRKGGEVKEYKHGGEVESAKYRKGGFQSGFLEGLKMAQSQISQTAMKPVSKDGKPAMKKTEEKDDKKRDGGMLIDYFKS